MRRTPMLRKPAPDHRAEQGYKEWHAPVFGHCAACGAGPMRLERHHCVYEQHVRAEGGDPYDLRNSLLLGAHCRCHSRQTTAAQRLPQSAIPDAALDFALELLGQERAALYVARYYAPG